MGLCPENLALNSLKVKFVTSWRSVSLKQGLALGFSMLLSIALVVFIMIPPRLSSAGS